MIFSLVMLMCDPTACITASGPIVATEQECHASVLGMEAAIIAEYPAARMAAYHCVAWGSEA